ncbi:MAG: biotin/lipoyl-binding protein [Chloroflexi bacterium]|nr:biotin/lipoyl-binding protein [Chloroflexota bacterium]
MVLSASRALPLLGALAAALVATACLPTLPVSSQPTTTGTTNTQAARSGGSTIRMGKAVRGDLTGVLTFAAPVQTKGEVAVVPRVGARVDQLNVDVGSRVRTGDVLFELDHSELDQQVLAAQAAQASAEARAAALKAGPKPEVLAAAQANLRAAQARVQALQSARDNAHIAALDERVKEAQAAVTQATSALQPDPQVVAQADAAANAARTKLAQLQVDPTKANDKPTMDAARADVTRAEAAAASARTPSGSQAALENARRDLQDAQQAQLLARLSTTAFARVNWHSCRLVRVPR